MERRVAHWHSVVVCIFVLAPMVAQKPIAIGENGWNITLPKGWSREKFADDVVAEQFVAYGSRGIFGGSKPVYFVVREHVGLVEGEADQRHVLMLSDSLAEAPLQHADEADWHRVSKVQNQEVDGFDLAWRNELLVVEGTVLHVQAWAARSDKKVLDAKVEELLDAVEAPGADSARGRGMVPERVAVTRGAVELSFESRPFLLRATPDADSLREVQTADARQGVRIWEMRDQPTAGQVIDQEVREMRAWDAKYRELRRAPRTIDGVECHEQWAAIDTAAYRVLVVPCGERRWLVVRHWADGAADVARPAREALFATMRVGKVAAAAGLPELPVDPAMAPSQRAAVRAFLAGVQRRMSHDGWVHGWEPEADGAWLVREGDAVHRRTADGGVHAVCPCNWPRAVVPWDGGWLVLSPTAVWRASLDAPPVAQSFAASLAVVVGPDLFCVRAERSVWQPDGGFAGTTRCEIVRRTAMAVESPVARIEGDVTDLAVAADGSRVLLATARDDDHAELRALDPGTGVVTTLATWAMVASLAPASTGWLVNGRPVGQPFGIWHLLPDGSSNLLLGGAHADGVQLLGEELWIAFRDGDASVLATVPLAHCKATGAALVPVAREALGAIGATLLLRVPQAPRTVAELDAACAMVQTIAQERLGRELSFAADELDAHIAADGDVSQLGPGGRIVLALLLAARVRADGAQWVEPAGSSWLDWVVAAEVLDDNPYAVVHHLPSLVVGALDDSDGTMEPTRILVQPRGGRRLLCGVDARTMRAAAAASVPAAFTAATDPAAWLAVARGEPANSFLRAHVHERLANAAAWRQLEAFARAAVAAKDATPDDHVGWLLARERLAVTAAAVDPDLERDLLAALRLHGRESRLWQQLAEHYERQSPSVVDRARVCWERVLEIRPWGPVADGAKAALQRLDGAK